MSEVTSITKSRKIPFLMISRKIVQFLSFFVVNYAILEWIFKTEFSFFDNLLQVLPFLQTAHSSWTAGAGLLEYAFYTMTRGRVPYLFIALIGLFGLFSGRIFCSWVCPTGFVQDLLGGLTDGRKFSIQTDRFLKKVKTFFLIVIFAILLPVGIFAFSDPQRYVDWSNSLGELVSNSLFPVSFSEFFFVTLPEIVSSFVTNVNLEGLFGLSGLKIFLFFMWLLIMVISMFYPRFYCRYMCPYAAGIRIFSKYSVLKLQRNPARCGQGSHCNRECENVCSMQVRILDEPFSGFTGNGECTLCLDCMEKCPHDAIKWKLGYN